MDWIFLKDPSLSYMMCGLGMYIVAWTIVAAKAGFLDREES